MGGGGREKRLMKFDVCWCNVFVNGLNIKGKKGIKGGGGLK